MKKFHSTIEQCLFVVLTLLIRNISSAEITPDQIEFFETKIRPVLAQECYECHNSRDKAKSGLVLDYRDGLLKGGDTGLTVVPGKPDESILMEALRHEYDLEMPKAGVKLDPPIVENFEKWIAMGAPDPRDKPPTDDELAEDTNWESILETRKNWWSFQPIVKPESPSNVDAFLQAGLEEKGLKSAEPANKQTVTRRLYFTLTGLPPTPKELDQAKNETHEQTVDRLLASPHFGERWARHWMDWIRYAESHGSEGDPKIDNAFMYRDYLIRALNEDVKYDQLLREHVAGDLLEKPRLNTDLGINESMIATAHWRMVFHGFAPTDALDEKVRFTDDQINVFTKAFQGLTVSCARCHDHKFDAISQADYYAMFGILGSTRPGRKLIDLPEILEKNKVELAALKPKIRKALAEDWLAAVADAKVPAEIAKLEKNWEVEKKKIELHSALREGWETLEARKRWDLGETGDFHAWYRYGNGLPQKSAAAGEFTIATTGKNALDAILPSGAYSNLLSSKHAARLTSPEFSLEGKNQLYVLARGDGKAMVRYVVQNYPRSGTVFKVVSLGSVKKAKSNGGSSQPWKWHAFDLEFWDGDDVHIELSTARDAPLLTKPDVRSWFGIRKAMLVEKGTNIAANGIETEHLEVLAKAEGETINARFKNALTAAITRWGKNEVTDADALFLDFVVKQNVLPNNVGGLSKAAPIIENYRKLEEAIKSPTRVHGLDEWTARNQPLYERGDHKKPLEDVPRRFLDAIDATPYQTDKSGRLELAADLLREDNPFTRRVIVNRIWHHVFGQGIVPTADNFGRMGEKPSHPELLDFLAVKFSDEFDWSFKKMVKYLVSTDAFQRGSTPSADAVTKDPNNQLLSHFSVKRLEAEVVRDALLVVAQKLDSKMYDSSVNGNAPRRSVYVEVIRNRLDPFLSVYDAPVPFSATGRRSETNVPAQSLTMLNNSFVVQAAQSFASATTEETDAGRIGQMWLTALGRNPSGSELNVASGFLDQLRNKTVEIATEQKKLDAQAVELQTRRNAILNPVREKLQAALAKENGKQEKKGPVDFGAIGHWDFAKGPEDQKGDADVEFVGNAKINGGALIVGDGGFGKTKPLTSDLKAKTLEIRIQLDDLDQRAGGAMTLQDLGGGAFDSIVYSERRPKRWMSGSSGFSRTNDFNGTDEKDVADQPVHLVIAYEANGTIRGYRNGTAYGRPYVAKNVQDYKKGASQILFGLRHGTGVSEGRALRGKIFEARLYDRALNESEIAALATGKRDFVSEKEVIDSLTDERQKELFDFETQIAQIQNDRKALGKGLTENDVWTNLAHSIFNLKEFIYVY
ncbi:MAG: DUF1553 domain-containing protein [Verrucomicrobiales bacterium]